MREAKWISVAILRHNPNALRFKFFHDNPGFGGEIPCVNHFHAGYLLYGCCNFKSF